MKPRTKKIIMIIAVIISIVVITSIVYDPIIKDLVVKKTHNTTYWNIHFANLSKPKIVGTSRVVRKPILLATHIGDYEITLSKPGDSVAYEFDIVNDGNLNAIIVNYVYDPKLCNIYIYHNRCDWDGNGISDEKDSYKIRNNITYSLKYTSNGKDVRVGDTLYAHSKKHVRLKLTYNNDAKEMPKKPIRLDSLGRIISYAQLR